MSTPLNNLRVLIVEDHMAMRKIVRTVIQSVGIRHIVEASDGAEALALLRGENVSSADGSSINTLDAFDFVVCDWAMPKMSGIELLAEIRSTPAISATPFLMLTAEGSKENIIKAIELGVTDYVVKPFPAGVLEAKIKAIVKSL